MTSLRNLLTGFVITLSCVLSAQTGTITGTVTDDHGALVPYATVMLFSLPDSSLIDGALTDDHGRFEMSSQPGNYFLRIRFLSYEDRMLPVTVASGNQTRLGNLILKPGAISITEVEVTAQRSEMVLKLDKRVFNVGTDLSGTGRNAAEILDNVPSVSVDIEGNLSLRGSQNVRILIDGKPSGLAGLGSTDALRQLQGSMIESVEIITNPSARYDAEGEVGIINIILKKERREGVNGSFQATAGYPHNYTGSFSINYRKKLVNLFASYGINSRKNPGSGYSIQEFTGDTVYSYERFREHIRGSLSHNLRVGSDFFLNDKNVLTVAGLYKYSTGTNEALVTYHDFDQNDEQTQTVTRKDIEEEDQQDIELTLSYLKTFAKKGREWKTDFRWAVNDDLEMSDLREVDDQGSEPIIQRSSNTEDERNFLFQSDYIHPFGRKAKFETGIKGTMRTISNDYSVEEQAPDETWFVLEDFDNHFLYSENIYAAYVIAANEHKRFSYQGGIRAELSDITTELIETNQVNPRQYLDLFPSVHLSYQLDSTNTMQISYSRRLTRPRFRALLPFYTFSDSRMFFSGNPDLGPEYTNAFEIGHLKYFERGSILSSVYYRLRNGVIQRITVIDSSGFPRIFPINLSTQNAYGIEFSGNYDITPWWRFNGSFNFYRAITNGAYEGEDLHSDTYAWTTKASSRWTIMKKLDFQTSFDYRAPRETTQGRVRSRYALDAGLSADILKGNGTVTLSGRDLLNTRKRRWTTETPTYKSTSEFQWRSREITLTFNYRLNQKKQREKTQREEGFDAGDEGGF